MRLSRVAPAPAHPSRRAVRPLRSLSATLAATLAAGALLTACTGGTTDEDAAPSGTAGPEGPLATETTIAALTGRLDQAGQDAVAEAVTEVVDDWIDAAYLGEFPRADFAPAFAGFTPGAAAKAQRLPGMTSAPIADRIEAAEATAREVGLDVLAVRGQPAGVTAVVNLTFETTGTLTGPQQVTGRLDLTPAEGTWKIFGFDITSTTGTAPAAPATGEEAQ